ncbi:protein C2-DOMAIN ABA-RELATED 11-like isoform X1 [Panicum virgatum]|uniref:protein C2-DOMAIN ABA-RELATED 11-like isoform X1 n=1 Tax=Panicum virgatum TaxID=38727 RepID=UPI0019D5AC26|nr:protein C2-DOMAIN ABA-RELATED 11-like isoform X1 [Panicum virgatum]XP_039794511.1 protein C2-DOMAIN ABA-RELATED 11-like isoform X1 [Panicum virgatum]XP_039794512.1 protein C2-DOMAIN ABA-RELATED 11-like isoform X1 [Panicum virgatum]
MTFSMKEPVGVIKFEVFDWDRFKYDDKMGHAFLDLQPVAAATKLRRALRLTAGETKLRKVALDVDNCLLSDSFVMYANGEVAVDAWLRLRDVESEQVASCSQKKSMPNGHVLIFLCVGDTTFGPVAEGARRQDVRSNEADVKSKRGDGPSRGSSGRKTKTGEDRATQVS